MSFNDLEGVRSTNINYEPISNYTISQGFKLSELQSDCPGTEQEGGCETWLE